MTILPLALVVFGGAAFFAYGGMEWLNDVMTPALAPVEGEVLIEGKPLVGAVVNTKPAKKGLMGAVGVTDEQGRFTLETDVKGTYQPGAYVGEHVVTVVKRAASGGGAMPALVSPEEYASFATTPFRITVSQSAEGAKVRFDLEGVLKDAPAPRPLPSQASNESAEESGENAPEDQRVSEGSTEQNSAEGPASPVAADDVQKDPSPPAAKEEN
jgi:hypothetical protein